jgi:hypothetical protein
VTVTPAVAAGVAGGIGPRTTVEGVVAQATGQRVVASSALQYVVAGAAGQGVVEATADEVLDTDQGIETGTAGVL